MNHDKTSSASMPGAIQAGRPADDATALPVPAALFRVSVVIPVYRGERTLPTVVSEVAAFASPTTSPAGRRFVIVEVLLVHDCGPDRSDLTIESLVRQYPFVKGIWLTRNFGQHAATLAGMASTTGDWVVTIDEDGQQDPRDIGRMLDTALDASMQLVYAQPTNPPPHGFLRNLASRAAKLLAGRILGNPTMGGFNSFRLLDGEIARTLGAYCGNGVYLDVGLFWITGRIGQCRVALRRELDRPSGYSYMRLLGHFWNLVFTTGTRPLRLITLLGFLSVFLAIAIACYAVWGRFVDATPVQGWASMLIVVAFFSGCILMALGVIAEYLAVTMGIAMGKPLFVVGSKPTRPPDAE